MFNFPAIMKPYGVSGYTIDGKLQFEFQYDSYASWAYSIRSNTIGSFIAGIYRIDICLDYGYGNSEATHAFIFKNGIEVASGASGGLSGTIVIDITYGVLGGITVSKGGTFASFSEDTTGRNSGTFKIDYFSSPEFGTGDRNHKIYNAYIRSYDSLLVLQETIFSTTFTGALSTADWNIGSPSQVYDLNPGVQLQSPKGTEGYIWNKNTYNFG